VAPSPTRNRRALPGGDDRGNAGPTARPAPTAPPSRHAERLDGAAPAGGRSEAVTRDDGPEPASRPTLRDLVQQERWIRSAAGAPRARPPADIAWRLRAWHGLQVTAGQVAAHLNGPAGRPGVGTRG
jgi:hypothetical protein